MKSGASGITNRLPRKAPATMAACGIATFSFRIIRLKITAKNGDILFNMEASARTR